MSPICTTVLRWVFACHVSRVTCYAAGCTLHGTEEHVTRHTSHVTRHTSHVTRHTSHVTRHTSHVTLQIVSWDDTCDVDDDFDWEGEVMSDIGKPQTPNPKPQTPNPKAQTPNPKPQTPNPKPQTPNPKPQTPNPKPQLSDSDDSNAEGFYANSYPDEDDDDDDLSHEGGW